MRISDWSSDVCSSDAAEAPGPGGVADAVQHHLRDGALAVLRLVPRLIIDGGRQAVERPIAVQRGQAAEGHGGGGLHGVESKHMLALQRRGAGRWIEGALREEPGRSGAILARDRKSTRLNSSH